MKTLKYVRWLAKEMGCGDWQIELSDKSVSDAAAMTEITQASRTAFLSLGSDWNEQSLETKKATLVHEVMHLHTAMLWEMIRTAESSMAPATYALYEQACSLELERAVDDAAVAWAKHLDKEKDKWIS